MTLEISATAEPNSAVALGNVKQVTAGTSSTCALSDGGTVKCWGANDRGQLGDDTVKNRVRAGVDVPGLSDVTALVAARRGTTIPSDHVCALVVDGTVKCWGANSKGQLGDGTTTDRSRPVDVIGLSGATAIFSGAENTCALVEGGELRCWGANLNGILGDGTDIDRRSPTPVVGLQNVTDLVIGSYDACAVVSNGAVKCWGGIVPSHFGTGTPDPSIMFEGTYIRKPTEVPLVSSVRKLSVSSTGAYCALLDDETVHCWGSSDWGQLGNGDDSGTSPSNVPFEVIGLTGVKALTAGAQTTCALLADRTVRCWGSNSTGSLGNGTWVSTAVPRDVVDLNGAVGISLGAWHGCAVTTVGGVKCWGSNIPESNLSGMLGSDFRGGAASAVPIAVTLAGGGTSVPPTVISSSAEPEPTTKSGCDDTTYFLGVRGSGEAPQYGSLRGGKYGDSSDPYPAGMIAELKYQASSAIYNGDRSAAGMGPTVHAISRIIARNAKTRLVSLGIAYPAVPVQIGTTSYPNDYRESVEIGSENLLDVLRTVNDECDQVKPTIIVSGYSQGAHVIEDGLARIQTGEPALGSLLTKVVLIGSPIHRAIGIENIGGGRTSGALFKTRMSATDRFVDSHPNVVTSICRIGDIVCDSAFADGLADPTSFFGIDPNNSLGKRIHTSYPLSDIRCPFTSLQQMTTICAANSALKALQLPLDRRTVSTDPGPSVDLDLQYSTRPGQRFDFMYSTSAGISGQVSKWINWFMYSTPTKLGVFETTSDGFATGSFTIPGDADPGPHTLVLRREVGSTFSIRVNVEQPGPLSASPILLSIDGDYPDMEPYPTDPAVPEQSGTGSLGTGSVGGN